MLQTFNVSVLPSFEVKLTPRSTYFHVNSKELTIDIKATYVQVFVLWIYRAGHSLCRLTDFRHCADAITDFIFIDVFKHLHLYCPIVHLGFLGIYLVKRWMGWPMWYSELSTMVKRTAFPILFRECR